MKRVIFDIALFLSLFMLPWWISATLAIAGIFLFKQFYEFLIASLVMYSLFAIPGTRATASPFWFPVIIGALYLAIQFARRYIILYKNEI